jgi:Holliday junction resolvase RusA-like endonuclease
MQTIINLTIQGKPHAKQRARTGKYGNFYNPSAGDMKLMLIEVKKQLPEGFIMITKGIPVIVNNIFFFEPTKSESTKKFLKLIENDDYPYIKKPDRDNLDKFVLDCLSEEVFYDDNQVYDGRITKYYSMNPRIEIEIIF